MTDVTQITIRLDRAKYREFKAECVRRNISPTMAIQELIFRQGRLWQKATSAQYRKEEVAHGATHDGEVSDARQLDLFLHTQAEEGL